MVYSCYLVNYLCYVPSDYCRKQSETLNLLPAFEDFPAIGFLPSPYDGRIMPEDMPKEKAQLFIHVARGSANNQTIVTG